MNHPLLSQLIKFKKRKTISTPSGYVYNNELGFWESCIDGSLLVTNPLFASIGSKKEDIETGEDNKGA